VCAISSLTSTFAISSPNEFLLQQGGALSHRIERWTCDQQVVGSNPTRGKEASSVTRCICNLTHQGAARGVPVILRPVKATSCFSCCGFAVAILYNIRFVVDLQGIC